MPVSRANNPDDPCQLVTPSELSAVIGSANLVAEQREMTTGSLCVFVSGGSDRVGISLIPAGAVPDVGEYFHEQRGMYNGPHLRDISGVGRSAYCFGLTFSTLTSDAVLGVWLYQPTSDPCADMRKIAQITVDRHA